MEAAVASDAVLVTNLVGKFLFVDGVYILVDGPMKKCGLRRWGCQLSVVVLPLLLLSTTFNYILYYCHPLLPLSIELFCPYSQPLILRNLRLCRFHFHLTGGIPSIFHHGYLSCRTQWLL